jgi:arylsulfatase
LANITCGQKPGKKLSGIGLDPFAALAPAQDYVSKFLLTFKEHPQRQKAARFNLDEVMKKLQESPGK